MTFEETKDLLQDLKNIKIRIRHIQQRIEEYSSIRSCLNTPIGRGKGSVLSPVESVVLKLESECKNFDKEFKAMCKEEDNISKALNYLTAEERDILISNYLDCKSHEELAEEYGCNPRTIQRKKDKAIKKLSIIL